VIITVARQYAPSAQFQGVTFLGKREVQFRRKGRNGVVVDKKPKGPEIFGRQCKGRKHILIGKKKGKSRYRYRMTGVHQREVIRLRDLKLVQTKEVQYYETGV